MGRTRVTAPAGMTFDLEDIRQIAEGVEGIVEEAQSHFGIDSLTATFRHVASTSGGSDLLVDVVIDGFRSPVVTLRQAPPEPERPVKAT